MNYKKFLLFFFIVFLLIELCSFIASKNKLLLFNSPPGYLKFKTIYNATDWRTEEQAWGAWHKKNFSTRHQKECFDVLYKTNDVGARSDFSFDKIESKNNIVLLGDSFAEGVGVKNANTFAGLLNKNYKTTLNFGSGGNFGPLQAYIIYKDLAKKFPHNEVVFLFLPANDFIDNDFEYYKKHKMANRYRPYFKRIGENKFDYFYPKNSNPQKNFPYENYSKNKIDKVKNFIKEYFWSYNFIKTLRYVITYEKNTNIINENNFGYFYKDDEAVDATFFFINELFKEINSDFNKTLIIIPTIRDLRNIQKSSNPYTQLRWYKTLTNLSKKHNFKIIDLAMNKKNLYSNQYIENGLKSWFLTCDGHWNGNGNKMAFEKFVISKN